MWSATPSRPQSFQSALPVWGATVVLQLDDGAGVISIRAPRVGSDRATRRTGRRCRIFQSALPVWGATREVAYGLRVPGISIRAPRVGSDPMGRGREPLRMAFQSALPVWGATPSSGSSSQSRCYFNPRSPCGERQGASLQYGSTIQISIRAPRVGSDLVGRFICSSSIFQSALPVWGATATFCSL